MKIEIQGQADFTFRLTADQRRMLCRLADAHYDSTCKAAFKPGGELARWMPQLFPDAEVRASFSEVDLCLKILEGREFQREYLDLGGALAWHFSQVLKLANVYYTTWRATYDPGDALTPVTQDKNRK